MSLQAYNSATDTLTPIAESDYKDSLEKISALPTASADLLNKCYLLTANQGAYIKGGIYQCQSDGSSGYTWILINGSGVPVNIIEDGNMNAVTSNAVADEFATLGTASTKDYTDNVAPNNHNLVESNAVYNAIANSISAIYKPQGSLSCAELTSALLIASNVGNVYNMTDGGTTSALFVQGAGTTINVNDTVGIIQTGVSEYKFNYMGNLIDLHSYQTKKLDTPLTIGGTQQTTVEGALGALNNTKQDILIFDTTPTNGSTNPVTSNGIYQAISNVTWSTVDGWTLGQTNNGLKIAYRIIQHSCGTTKSAGLFTNSYYSVQNFNISNLGFRRCISAYADVYASYTENLFAKAVVDWDMRNVYIPFWSDGNSGTWDGRVTLIGF